MSSSLPSAENKDQADSDPGELASAAEAQSLRALLEKNLKWSQIIYEQNRKLNSKLLWLAVGSWVKVAIILIPLGLAVWFLPRVWNTLQANYGQWLKALGRGQPINQMPLEGLMKILPLNPEQQARLKTLLK